MPGRTIAIGDIHGCSRALAALVAAVAPGPEDTVVTLGDYVDRGLDSRGVLEQLLDLAGRCRLVPLLGNHEEMMLAARHSIRARALWLECGGQATLDSYDDDGRLDAVPERHWVFLEDCRAYAESPTHLFVHANYQADLPLDRQSGEVLRWTSFKPAEARPHCSGKAAVLGHTPQRTGDVLDLGFVRCIDTYCHGGQWLTAVEVGTGRTWQANERGQLRADAGPGNDRPT